MVGLLRDLMSKLKPRKDRDVGINYRKYYIRATYPMWRNWIRIHRYTYMTQWHHPNAVPPSNIKDAVEGIVEKYKTNGQMLMKTQGQDFW